MKEQFRCIVFSVMCFVALGISAKPDKNYLCFTANTAGSTVELKKQGSPFEVSIQYSTDDGMNWTTVDFSSVGTTGTVALANVGGKVYFRGDTEGYFSKSDYDYYCFKMNGSVAASGNVMSLVDSSCAKKTIDSNYCFYNLFAGCTCLTSAPELPATTLTKGCYQGMFAGCACLSSAPNLPAMTLAYSCYSSMFYGCTSLTMTPELPATTLATYCYSSMFAGCTELVTGVSELPATTLANSCYMGMFSGCTKLPATPKLPSTTLAVGCYQEMFSDCSSLATVSALNATALAADCYFSMFKNCSSLTTAPKLPATIMATRCYNSMFFGCTSLTKAPELPATTLAENCYNSMFSDCSSLESAPELPATNLPLNGYSSMFSGCSKLNNIAVAFADGTLNNKGISNWLKGVSSDGTIACPEALSTTGVYPAAWTVKTTFDISVSSVGWASMYINLPLVIPAGVEVYYASAVEGNVITLTPISAGKIAPGTAVIVKATAGKVQFPILGEDVTPITDNLFAGTSVGETCEANSVYVLSGVNAENGNPQFQNYTGTALVAHKAYLPKSALGGVSGAIQFRFDDAASIAAPLPGETNDVPAYNLLGQPVHDGYQGIVVRGGRKVFNH